jgi:outer membrane protein OmpA-like peptidoglycan-associated protein
MNNPSLKRRPTLAASALVAALVATGCAETPQLSQRQKGTATGAAAGAVGGAVLSKATGGNAATGAVIGGALGAVAGNLWSKRMEDKRAEMQRATQGTGIDVLKTQDNQLKVNVPADFSFDVGSAAIKPQMRPVLDQFAQGLDPRMRVTVIGHTDNTGGPEINNRLSLERAASVRDYLRNRGLDTSKMIINGRGENEPVVANDTATGRAQNRRVEIYLSEPQA